MLTPEREEWLEYRIVEMSEGYPLRAFMRYWVDCRARRILLFGLRPEDKEHMWRGILSSLDLPIKGRVEDHNYKIDQNSMTIDQTEFPFIWCSPDGFDPRGFWGGYHGMWADAVWALPGIDIFKIDRQFLEPIYTRLFNQIKGVPKQVVSGHFVALQPNLKDARSPWYEAIIPPVEEL